MLPEEIRSTHFGVEAFAIAVFPVRAGFDVESPGSCFCQPLAQLLGNELRAVIRTNVFRDAVLDHGLGKHVDDLVAVDPAAHIDRQALPRVLVDQVQKAHNSSVMGESAHEIVCPDVMRPLWPQPHTRAVIEPQTAARFLLLRNLQSFATPNPLHAVLAHVPARFLELDGDASISIPAILSGQCNDGPGQRVFVVPLRGPVALRAAWLVNQLARMTLTRPLLLGMLHSSTAPLRA